MTAICHDAEDTRFKITFGGHVIQKDTTLGEATGVRVRDSLQTMHSIIRFSIRLVHVCYDKSFLWFRWELKTVVGLMCISCKSRRNS